MARTDQAADPGIVADLLLARRGTAYFSRQLDGLHDDELAALSWVPGWDRARVVAQVGLEARELAYAVEELRTGRPAVREGDVELPDVEPCGFAATLPGAALRHLHAHAAVHLSVEWRDLPATRWSGTVEIGRGALVGVGAVPTAAAALRRRTRQVWGGALALDALARFDDVPSALGIGSVEEAVLAVTGG